LIEDHSVQVNGWEFLGDSAHQSKKYAEETLLHIAAKTSNLELIQFLLSKG